MGIRIMVFSNAGARSNERPLFERIVDYDNSLVFPFESTYKTLKCLFGSQSIIVIELS